MVTIPWQPAFTTDQLQAMADPISANQPEVIPWQLYDSQQLVSATSTALVYYQTINGDKTLSNMEGPGQLPDPQYLIVQYVACDILAAPAATVLASEPNAVWADMEAILKTARTTFNMNMSNKNYGPFKLTMCASTGGTTGAGYGYGTAVNGTSAAIGNVGVPGSGGYPFCGALVLPPKIGFNLTLNFAAGGATLSATRYIVMSLVGQLYRRVL
jgi:hypothetical protein